MFRFLEVQSMITAVEKENIPECVKVFATALLQLPKNNGILKQKLAELYPYDIDGYCLGKEAFVKDLEQRAIEWYKK